MAIWDPPPPVKLPKQGSASFKILLFIGQNRGVTTTQVQRHLIEDILQQKWDPKKRAGLWNSTLYGVNREGLFPKYCVKFDKLWYLTEGTAAALTKVTGYPLIHRRTVATLDKIIPPRDLSVENAERLPNLPNPPKHELVRLAEELEAAKKKVDLARSAHEIALKALQDKELKALNDAEAVVYTLKRRLKELLHI